MASDTQGGKHASPGGGPGPRPVVPRPGSPNRGFASMDPERQREAAGAGRAAPQGAHSHEPAPPDATREQAARAHGAREPATARARGAAGVRPPGAKGRAPGDENT